MKRSKPVLAITGIIMMTFLSGNMIPASAQAQSKSTQTKPQTVQAKQVKPKTTKAGTKAVQSKSGKVPVRKPAHPVAKPAVAVKPPDAGTLKIGNQLWAVANLDVSRFRNGDSIPEARTNEEWVKAGEAGKPAWCYYNNDLVIGKKYGKLYNWYALNDPRGLAPAGWSLPNDQDWVVLTNYMGGPGTAGSKLKSTSGWSDKNDGTNESGFNGLPGGYRVENGKFMNIGSIATWWSTTENKSNSAFDHYLVLSGGFPRSDNPKQCGESVRCIKK